MLIKTAKSPGWGKQKPQQRGPLSSVQGEVFRNAEAMGIDPAKIMFLAPFWDGAGTNITRLFGPKGTWNLASGVGWEGNSLVFPGNNYDLCDITLSADDPNYAPAQSSIIVIGNISNLLNTDSDSSQALFKSDPMSLNISANGSIQYSVVTDISHQRAWSIDGVVSSGDQFNISVVGRPLGQLPSVCLDGYEVAYSKQLAGSGSASPQESKLGLGCDPGYSWASQFYGKLDYVFRTSELLPSDVVARLHENPYALLEKNSATIYSIPPIMKEEQTVSTNILLRTSKSPGVGKQKPQQWGPIDEVRASVLRNAELLGIDPVSVMAVLPFWEGASGATNIMSGIATTTRAGTPTWTSGGVRCSVNSSLGLADNSVVFDYTNMTAMFTFRHNGTAQSYARYLFWGVEYHGYPQIQKQSNTNCVVVPSAGGNPALNFNVPVADMTGHNSFKCLQLDITKTSQDLRVGKNVYSLTETMGAYTPVGNIFTIGSKYDGNNAANMDFGILSLFDKPVDYVFDENPYILLEKNSGPTYSLPAAPIDVTQSEPDPVNILLRTSKSPGYGKQKPQQWGPLAEVQASVFRNAEELGIDYGKLKGVWAFWEGSGKPVNLVNGEFATTSAYPWIATGPDNSSGVAANICKTNIYPDSNTRTVITTSIHYTSTTNLQGCHDSSSHRMYIGRSSNGNMYVGRGANYNSTMGPSGTVPLNKLVSLAMTVTDSGSVRCFCEGAYIGSMESSFSGTSSHPFAFLGLGRISDEGTACAASFGLISDETFTDDQLIRLTKTPYALLERNPGKTISIPADNAPTPSVNILLRTSKSPGYGKQKPQQWGPLAEVQRSLLRNMERVGLDPQKLLLAYPFWEGSGSPKNLADGIAATVSANAPEWVAGGLNFNETLTVDNSRYLTIPKTSGLVLNDWTFVSRFTSNSLTISDDGYILHIPNAKLLLGATDDTENGGHVGEFRCWPGTSYRYSGNNIVDMKPHTLIASNKLNTSMKLYVDNELRHSGGGAAAITADGNWNIGDSPGNTEEVHGQIDHLYFFTSAIDESQAEFMQDAPYALLERNAIATSAIIIKPSGVPVQVEVGEGGITLTVGNLSHAIALDNTDLVQKNILSVNNLSHIHGIDNVSFDLAVLLIVQNLLHSQSIESISLTQAHTLAMQDLQHSTSLELTDLVQASQLAINNLLHQQEIETADLVQKSTLAIQNLLHSLEVENTSLTQKNILAVQSILHSFENEALALTQKNILSINNLIHSQNLQNINLGSAIMLAVQSLQHGLDVTSPTLIQKSTLVLQSLLHSLQVEGADLTQKSTLTLQSLQHTNAVTEANLVQKNLLAVANLQHINSLEDFGLAQKNVLSINNLAHGHGLANVEITLSTMLAIQDLLHSSSVANAALTQKNVLAADNLVHAQSVTAAELLQKSQLIVDNLMHLHDIDNLSLSAAILLAVQDLHHAGILTTTDLTQAHVLTVNDLGHSVSCEQISLTQQNLLNVEDLLHNNDVGQIILAIPSQGYLLTFTVGNSNFVFTATTNNSLNFTTED